jgi:Acyl-CoA thioester hydrolase/BAAT N-terminal region/BAAT / Acyl-CoA thioester hydrolase C terminal
MRILADLADALYDDPISIRLGGFPPTTQLTLRASSIDDAQHRWDSCAQFVTDADGAVDLARTAPDLGSYGTADATGLLWSMTLDPELKERTPFTKTTPTAAKITLNVELKSEIVASVELTRSFMAKGVVQTDVTADGLVAKIVHHEDGGRPGVILVSGSGGGLSIDHPALLASRGYAVMPLGYFPGLDQGNVGNKSAWTWRGEHMPSVAPTSQGLEVCQKPPVALTLWFLECLKNRESVERAVIAVEKIGGPVLMFSGTDDQMWLSLNLADIAMRLIANDFAHLHEHVAYAGAGHFIRFPYTPVISEIFHPVAKAPMALGGTPEANQFANVDSWRRCLAVSEYPYEIVSREMLAYNCLSRVSPTSNV